MNEDQDTLHVFIEKTQKEFNKLPFEEVAFPRGCKGVNKYRDSMQIYKKGTPIHVKGALLYNNLLENKNLENKYSRIFEGDKIKFAYLKLPNPLHDTVISVPGVLPKQLNMDGYIDYNMQFEKSFIDPLKNILNAINWTTEQTITVEDFFK